MWLACALIILFSVGFVLPVLLDITITPDSEFTTLSKGTWLVVAGAFWVFGSIAWLLVGRPRRSRMYRSRRYGPDGFGPGDALLRHPAAQAAGSYVEPGTMLGSVIAPAPLGPDDDPEFLEELSRRIRDSREDG
jgi:hypothetical protein